MDTYLLSISSSPHFSRVPTCTHNACTEKKVFTSSVRAFRVQFVQQQQQQQQLLYACIL